jgi:adenylosuccinate synthase
MPVTVVVGGQFGSEGKGKVALQLAGAYPACVMVRVGGPNSGHTIIAPDGALLRLRQVPVGAVLPSVVSVLAAGTYIDPEVLLHEARQLRLAPGSLVVDPYAVVVTPDAKRDEAVRGLRVRIGSTESGTGSAVLGRIARDQSVRFARDEPCLRPWIGFAGEHLDRALRHGRQVIVEGTQGFGLSVLHSPDYPYVTSRDTTAAGALSEAGLSPIDVEKVVLVLRAFPIRVAGNSGPLPSETTWSELSAAGGHDHQLEERTTVTNRIRRVARFDQRVVRRAIAANHPTDVVLNHVDYCDHAICGTGRVTRPALAFVRKIEDEIGRRVDWLGLGPADLSPEASAKNLAV